MTNGVVAQAVTPALPEMLQVRDPLGAGAPVVPVTVVVKVRVAPSVATPFSLSTAVGST